MPQLKMLKGISFDGVNLSNADFLAEMNSLQLIVIVEASRLIAVPSLKGLNELKRVHTQVDNLSYMASRVSKTAEYRRFSTEYELKTLAFSPTGFDQSKANGLSQISEG